MSQVTGPFPVAPGSSTRLDPPQGASTMVLANLSPYLLEMHVGADVRWLEPWTESLFEGAGSASTSITPQIPGGASVPNGTASQVQATWYAEGEKPAGTWPMSLVANALAVAITSGVVTVTGDVPVHNGTPSPLQVGGSVAIAGTARAATIPGRPSAGVGRTYVTAARTLVAAGATLYTVTVGKTLFVTTLSISAYNSSAAADGDLRVQDGAGTVLVPFVLPQAGAAAAAVRSQLETVTMCFEEPLQFTTDLRVVIAAGTVTYAASFVGYEE